MSQKHQGGPGPVPPGNQSHKGPAHAAQAEDATSPDEASRDQEKDTKGRQGDYKGKGEHPIQQPSALNDG